MLSKISTLTATGLLGVAALLGTISLGSTDAAARGGHGRGHGHGHGHMRHGHGHHGGFRHHHGHRHHHHRHWRHYGHYYSPAYYGCRVWSGGYNNHCVVWW